MNIRRFFPASLAARTVLLVFAVVAVAEYTTFSFLLHNRRAAHINQTVQFVAGQVRLLQNVLPRLGESERQRFAKTEGGEQWLQLRPDGDFVPKNEAKFGFARRLRADLTRQLGEPVLLRDANPREHGGVWIGFMADDQRWWLVLPSPRFEPPRMPSDLWWGLAATLAVLLLIAGFFVRSIVRPLARLGEAVTATGAGQARRVNPEGPTEVRRLAERHNTMLEELAKEDATRREMLAGLTHDLRAPLARLRVRLALLENDAERAGLARDTDSMERIVGQCLAFLHSEDTPAQAPPPLSLADAVSDEVARQGELGRPVAIIVSEAAMGAQVRIDHGHLQRLLDNLIDNALQHGAAPIELSLDAEFANSTKTITLRLRDHGPGIAAEQRARAQEAFVQIDPARATRGSCGLGLAIVRKIVLGCGGSLTLAEATGGGLEVIVCVPLCVEAVEASHSV